MESGTSPADLRAIMDSAMSDNGNFGGNTLLIVLFLLAFGGRGFGFGGMDGAGGTLNTDFAILERKMDGLANGQCQAGYENARLANETQLAMLNGFNQTQMAMQQGFAQQAQCCCDTNRNIDAVRYEAAQNKCELLTAINEQGSQIRAMMQQDKIESLQQQLNAQGQQMQTMQMQGAIDRATCGVVRYPQTIAYSAGASPFFGSNACGCAPCNTCI